MASSMENITEMESERVEQEMETGEQSQDNVMETDKETETGEQSQDNVKETENENRGETVGEEATFGEHKDSPCPMVIEEDTSLASSKMTPILEKETNNDDPSKIDDEKTHDEKNSQLETSPHLSPFPSVALDPEEGLIKATVEDTIEHNTDTTVQSEVSSDLLKHDGDSVMVDKDTAVVHGETTTLPDTKLSDDKGSPHHHDDSVMEQDKAAEEHDIISSGGHNEIPVNPDTKLSEEKGSPHHHANTDMKQDKAAEEHGVISSGDHNKFPVNPDTNKESPHHHANTEIELEKSAEAHEIIPSGDHNESPANPDTKVVEENSERIDEGEANNMNLADHGSGPVDHDQSTTTELDERPEVPGSETVLEREDKPSEPLIETSMNGEKEPDMPATKNLTENDQNSDVLTAGVPGDNDEVLYLLPATQTLSDHNKGMDTLEAEPSEDMKLDVPDSKLVAEASVDATNNNDANAKAPTNAEKEDNSIVTVISGAENESASVRSESGPPYVASSSIKSEVGVSGGLNNGVHKRDIPPGFDGNMSAKQSFLLDDMSDGNESGTEEDQSAFMKELHSFFKERGMDFKPPKFYGEGLNCLKLWRAVTRLGGYDKVTGCKLWRQVGESFRPPKTCTTVSWTFRGFYEKALLEYERHKVIGGELHIPLASEPEPMSIDNQASGSGRARRDAAARAMQGWHSQRLNGNGEVSDPAMKDKNLVLHQKREKQIGTTTPGLLKRKRPSSAEHGAKSAVLVSRPMSDVTVVDVGPPADWVKINVQRTQDCFEVYALVPGLVREEVRVQSDPAGRLVISGEPENPMNPWGATPFKKIVSLPTRIDPHHTSAVVTLNGQLFVRVPLEQSD
uniref:AT-rich interactive domain-containing protein 3 n=1 Tax=Noccaea caerulescens TaxID=107243 RepID=A0A1J3HFX0_NOCCA